MQGPLLSVAGAVTFWCRGRYFRSGAEAVTFVQVQRLLLSLGCGGRYFRSGVGTVTFIRVQRPLLSFGCRGR